jgi:hypothetical protein
MISLPIVSLTSLRLATMQGLHRVVLGQMPEDITISFNFYYLTISSYWFLRNQENPHRLGGGLKIE